MLTSLQAWQDRALEWTWMVRALRSGAIDSSWPLEPQHLETVLLRWPSTYQWPPCTQWVEPLFRAFRRFVRTEVTAIPQPYKGVVLVQFAIGRSTYDVGIDYSDYLTINEDCAGRCLLYFKMQYAREGYSSDHILPGGYVAGHHRLYQFLPHLRAIRDTRSFAYDVYGRFSLEFAKDLRQKAVHLLSEQQKFRYEGGLAKVRYSRFLREVAQAKICIDLPGNGDFCFRLIDYLAVGACVIGPRHRTKMPLPLVDRKHIVYTQDDLSDLIELCTFYLENAQAREEICQESRHFFDKYLHREQLAAYYLHSCLQRAARQTPELNIGTNHT